MAEAPYRRGDYGRAIEIVSEGLELWPHQALIHYQLACYHALAGNTDEALDHLGQATSADGRTKEWAGTDHDLDSVRDDPRFARAVE